MKKYLKISMLLLSVLFLSNCKKNKELENAVSLVKETIEEQDATETAKTQPIARWKVKRELDSAGNVIRYDSIYSWSYTSKEGEIAEINMDSVMRSFYDQIDNQFPLSLHNKVPGMFEWDSLFYKRFLQNEDFRSNWEKEFQDIQSSLERMDSLRYEFYKDFN